MTDQSAHGMTCPTCGEPPIDVAKNHDPFQMSEWVRMTEIAVEARCSAGHIWIEAQKFNKRGEPDGSRRKMVFEK